MRISFLRGPLILMTLSFLSCAFGQSPTRLPERNQLVGLLRHAVRWHYSWQADTGDQGLLSGKTAGHSLVSRSLLVSAQGSRQIWSFIPALGMHVSIVLNSSTQQWKLLSVAEGESYKGRIDDVAARYVRDHTPRRDLDCAPELSIRTAPPSGKQGQSSAPGSTIPLSRPCPPRTSAALRVLEAVDAQLEVGPLPGWKIDSDLACQRDAIEITKKWVVEFDRSMSGRIVVPACSILDPKVFVLLEPQSGQPKILPLFRDTDGSLAYGRAIERQDVVGELGRRIRLTSTRMLAVQGGR